VDQEDLVPLKPPAIEMVFGGGGAGEGNDKDEAADGLVLGCSGGDKREGEVGVDEERGKDAAFRGLAPRARADGKVGFEGFVAFMGLPYDTVGAGDCVLGVDAWEASPLKMLPHTSSSQPTLLLAPFEFGSPPGFGEGFWAAALPLTRLLKSRLVEATGVEPLTARALLSSIRCESRKY